GIRAAARGPPEARLGARGHELDPAAGLRRLVGRGDDGEHRARLARARRRLRAVANGVDEAFEEPCRPDDRAVARVPGEPAATQTLLEPRHAAEAEIDLEAGLLAALQSQLERRPAAERGAERRALAVRADFHVPRARRGEPVDRDLPEKPVRELERHELDRVGVAV